jgi:hypothetical protein
MTDEIIKNIGNKTREEEEEALNNSRRLFVIFPSKAVERW